MTAGAQSSGRIYVGSSAVADEAPGSGAAFPQVLHGGPGRAGGGQELGGLLGGRLYMQRIALQGPREVVDGLAGVAPPPVEQEAEASPDSLEPEDEIGAQAEDADGGPLESPPSAPSLG